MNVFDPESRTFALGSPLPPSTRVTEAQDSLGAQRLFERRHKAPDGSHNDELVCVATAHVTQAAGVYTVVYSKGVSIAKQGTGWLRLTLAAAMNGSANWMAWVIPLYEDHNIFPYEALDVGAIVKSSTQVDIKLVNASGGLDDNGFDLFVYGKRG